MRGPAVLPGPLSPRGVPGTRSPREIFDSAVLGAVRRLDARWHDQLGRIEFAVEETPLTSSDWTSDTVPLASLVRGTGSTPTRIVLFRRPIELRCESRADLSTMALTILVEQVSDLLGLPPEEIDPGYEVE
ncbi:MAG TPA: metallopeptidase family protein [Nocardioidaceae bacterium]|nr:metallopeptidase family protein [Nocardioidaceae bacterium]